MVLLIVYINDNIQGQPNESQSLKSNQTFHFEAERYYFNWIWGLCSPRVLFMRTSSENNKVTVTWSIQQKVLNTKVTVTWSIQHYGPKSKNIQLCF